MIAKFFKFVVLPIVLLVVLFFGFGFYTMWKHEMFEEPTFETVAPEIPDSDGKPMVLLFNKTNSFRHFEAIDAAQATFEDFAESEGWTLFVTENSAINNAEHLAKFDLIVWNNVTGDVLNADQQEAFKTYLEGGGQFLGIHGTGGSREYSWDWYPRKLIGTQFVSHPNIPHIQDAELTVEDQSHPATAHLPETWVQNDEWYTFADSPRDRVNVLVSIDEESYNPSTWMFGRDLAMGDHPMIWHHDLGEGRVFYSALGHEAKSYSDKDYRQLLLNAAKWLMTPVSENEEATKSASNQQKP